MTSAQRGNGEEVLTTARLPDGREVEGKAWFRVDENEHTIQWALKDRTPTPATLRSTVKAIARKYPFACIPPACRAGDQAVQDGLGRTLANIKRLVEERPST